MKNIIVSISLLIFVFFPVKKFFAQLDSLSKGDRIRITYQEYLYKPTICSFEKVVRDSLIVGMHNKIFPIPLERIQKIEICKNKERNTVTGIIIGSVIGGLALGITMHTVGKDKEGFSKVGQLGFWGGFASGLIIGGSIGALIGYNTYTDKWSEIVISKQFEL